MTRGSSFRGPAFGAYDQSDFDNLIRIVQSMSSVLNQLVQNNNDSHTLQPIQDTNGTLVEKFKRLKPLAFLGGRDPLIADRWLMRIEKIFEVMNCTPEQRVTLAVFLFEGEAEHWWQLKKESLIGENHHITWERFLEAFNKEYFPEFFKDQKEVEFLELKQGNLKVSEYASMFAELARFAPHIVSDESRKAKKFQQGLREEIQSKVALIKLTRYHDVLERAQIAESMNKGPYRFERPVGGTRTFVPNRKRPQEHGRFEKRPRLMGDNQWCASKKNVCTARGMDYVLGPCLCPVKKCYKRGSTQHLVRMCTVMQQEQNKSKKQKRLFPFTQKDVKTSQSAVEGMLPIFDNLAHVLIDTGSTHSFVSQKFACHLNIDPVSLDSKLVMSTPASGNLTAESVYKSCVINIADRELLVDLILLEFRDFDVILGMDWLTSYYASVDCRRKVVTFNIPKEPVFHFQGTK